MIDKNPPENAQLYWQNIFNMETEDLEWEEVHTRNFSCTIETQLRSFYCKIIFRAIAFNNFLFKIGRKDSPLCTFCTDSPETFVHIFCECRKVKPIWETIQNLVNDNLHSDYNFNNFDIMFGISDDSFLPSFMLQILYLQIKIPKC
jgi:hypothetical protein